MRAYALGGWGTPMSQHNILTRKNSHIIVLVLRTGFEPLVMESIGSRGWPSNNWATMSPANVPFFEYSHVCMFYTDTHRHTYMHARVRTHTHTDTHTHSACTHTHTPTQRNGSVVQIQQLQMCCFCPSIVIFSCYCGGLAVEVQGEKKEVQF